MEERNFFQKIYHFFDKLEDRVRGWLSHRTIFMALSEDRRGSFLAWGVAHGGLSFTLASLSDGGSSTIDAPIIWDGLLSLLVGTVLLLMTGLFVSSLSAMKF